MPLVLYSCSVAATGVVGREAMGAAGEVTDAQVDAAVATEGIAPLWRENILYILRHLRY